MAIAKKLALIKVAIDDFANLVQSTPPETVIVTGVKVKTLNKEVAVLTKTKQLTFARGFLSSFGLVRGDRMGGFRSKHNMFSSFILNYLT